MPNNVKCENCNHLRANGWCPKKVDSPVPDMERDCPHYWQKTNADVIRAMSDDELADMFRKFCLGMEQCESCPLYDRSCAESDRLQRWKHWMQSPVFKGDQ